MKTLTEAKSYARLPDPIKTRLNDEQQSDVWERAQSEVETDQNLSWGDASTMSLPTGDGSLMTNPRLTIRSAHMGALQDMGLWKSIKNPAIRNSDSQAEDNGYNAPEGDGDGGGKRLVAIVAVGAIVALAWGAI
jgi:hypothetical protein